MTTDGLALMDRGALDRPATAAEIRAQVNLIQEVMKAVMKVDVHFGTIPGTPKPTLYKAGSEKILSTFRIAVEPIVEDLSTQDEARFRVLARGIAQGSGAFLGAGVGEASSNEEKYKFRAAVCQEEWDETPEDRRRRVWKKGREKPYAVQQVRTNHADIANTVLKMAKKRAQIDMTLTVTAASDVFAQDIEDLPEEIRESVAGDTAHAREAPPQAPTPRQTNGADASAPASPAPPNGQQATTGAVISEPQRKRFYAIWNGAGWQKDEIKHWLLEQYNISDDHLILRSQYEQICKAVEAGTEK